MTDLPEELSPFLDRIIEICSAQFPLKCGKCGREYRDFRYFVLHSKPTGRIMTLREGPEGDFSSLSCVNCSCGSTMCLKCTDSEAHKGLSAALRNAADAGRVSESSLLEALRAEVRRRALL